MSANYLSGLDDATQEEFGNPTPDRTIREHVSNIIKLHFEQQSVITQAQILHGLIKHKKIKRATKLLGFKDVKNKNACENVVENVTTALSAFGKSRKNDIRAARREITTNCGTKHLKKSNGLNNVKVAPRFKKNNAQIH